MPHSVPNNNKTNCINGTSGHSGGSHCRSTARLVHSNCHCQMAVGMACQMFSGNVTSASELWELCATDKDGCVQHLSSGSMPIMVY